MKFGDGRGEMILESGCAPIHNAARAAAALAPAPRVTRNSRSAICDLRPAGWPNVGSECLVA